MSQRNILLVLSSGLLAMLFMSAPSLRAQPALPTPDASPHATLTQTVGIVDLTIDYHRPGVKGREIWGKVVPFGEVWRAGANENTTISFPHDLTVEGKPLSAGTYGLHMIPGQQQWTVIFSKNSTSWGSYHYAENEDALRVTVTPEQAPFTEWLTYGFSDLTDSSAVVSLSWEKLRIPFRLSMDMRSIIVAHARNAYLRGMGGFTWQGNNQAAAYCLRTNTNLTEALAWADRSIAINENFANLQTKAGLLEKTGKPGEAEKLRERALSLATEVDINNLGYEYMNAGKVTEAIELFERNVKSYPDSWNVYDSLGEGLEKKGDVKGAIKNYERALKLVGDDANKKRITAVLDRLKAAK